MNYKNKDKTLLILDLDETLVHASKTALNRKADFMVFDYHIYKRPYLEEFLKSLEKDYLLAIWSSASDDYVQAVVNEIIPSTIKLEFVWGRSKCSYRRNFIEDEYGYLDNDFFNHYHYIKPLKKLKKQGYKLERILIVDDSPHKSKENYGNAIYPIPFEGDKNDVELKLLTTYLKTLKNKTNVRRIEKRFWRDSE